ncbi:hypothetical protein HG560_03665 [Helicobacter pylori]|uniref:Uncharacterized protein n=2 Tax=Helicobacter pylori TaxID=210 RepID=A0AAE7P7S6_HELPX|nr:hypothetical protein [Helicobacter pylori]AFH97777.1 hypothetical protein HPSH417_03130 [Helicobacter pylori Shi417]AFH99362.1 hypothetical protein HPSH169_03320 [Helicobacter pylori Shi169]AFI00957.1 hypothetical protein HPSH112_03780 [Helicobacter pylori Shi112]QQW90722.1 hypothetical protein HG564_03195 [Helicobacter pylori]QQW93633.1 hypothetical protein HG560_03665 [Helicobacter pylori]
MGNLAYYAYMYLILFICLLPVLLVGLAWRLSRPPLKQNIPNKNLSLEYLSEQVKNLKSAPTLEKLKNSFNERFKICPKDKETLWLETIQNLVASEFFELEDAINFGQDLENANPSHAQKIANSTGLAIKNKKEKG